MPVQVFGGLNGTHGRRQSSYSEEFKPPIPSLNCSKVEYVGHRRQGSLSHLWIAARDQRCELDGQSRRDFWIPRPERGGKIDDNSSSYGTAASEFRICKNLRTGLLERRADHSAGGWLSRGRCAAVFVADNSPWPADDIEDSRTRSDAEWA